MKRNEFVIPTEKELTYGLAAARNNFLSTTEEVLSGEQDIEEYVTAWLSYRHELIIVKYHRILTRLIDTSFDIGFEQYPGAWSAIRDILDSYLGNESWREASSLYLFGYEKYNPLTENREYTPILPEIYFAMLSLDVQSEIRSISYEGLHRMLSEGIEKLRPQVEDFVAEKMRRCNHLLNLLEEGFAVHAGKRMPVVLAELTKKERELQRVEEILVEMSIMPFDSEVNYWGDIFGNHSRENLLHLIGLLQGYSSVLKAIHQDSLSDQLVVTTEHQDTHALAQAGD